MAGANSRLRAWWPIGQAEKGKPLMKMGLRIAAMAIGTLAVATWETTVAAQDASGTKPNLAGAWTYNNELSDPPPAMGERATGGGGAGGQRGGGGGGFGGLGRGAGGGFGGARPDPEQMRRTQEALRQAAQPPARLIIIQEPNEVTFTDGDGRSQRLSTSNEKEKHQLGDQTVETRTRWDGSRLVKQIAFGSGIDVTETYTIDDERRQLQVLVKIDTPRGSRTTRRVYDDASRQ